MLHTPQEDPGDARLADLFHQLVDDGTDVVRAEINLYKQVALHRAGKARNGLIAVAIGAVLMLGALITLLVMLAISLGTLIGPLGGGIVVTVAAAGVAFLLVRTGIGSLRVLGGDEEERAALRSGGRRP